MCLRTQKTIKKRVKAELDEKGFIYAWKSLYRYRGGATSEFRHHEWAVGVNASNRKSKRLTLFERISFFFDKLGFGSCVFEGFHVYLNEEDAGRRNGYRLPVRVKCYKKDFVSAGLQSETLSENAVFTQVELEVLPVFTQVELEVLGLEWKY